MSFDYADLEDEEIFGYEGRIVICANLHYDCRPSDLRDLFLPCGKLLRVDIERTKKGDSNGLGFLEFEQPNEARSAVDEFHGKEFMNRTLKCKICENPPPELTRFYIRPLNKRIVSDRVRQRIIEEAKTGIPYKSGPIPNRDDMRHRRRLQRRFNEQKRAESKSYSSSSYSSSSESESK